MPLIAKEKRTLCARQTISKVLLDSICASDAPPTWLKGSRCLAPRIRRRAWRLEWILNAIFVSADSRKGEADVYLCVWCVSDGPLAPALRRSLSDYWSVVPSITLATLQRTNQGTCTHKGRQEDTQSEGTSSLSRNDFFFFIYSFFWFVLFGWLSNNKRNDRRHLSCLLLCYSLRNKP